MLAKQWRDLSIVTRGKARQDLHVAFPRRVYGTPPPLFRRKPASQSIHYDFAAILPAASACTFLRPGKATESDDMAAAPGPVNTILTTICLLEIGLSRFDRLGGLSAALFKKSE